MKSNNFGLKGWAIILFGALFCVVGGSFWGAGAANIVVPNMAAQLGVENSSVLYVNGITQIAGVAAAFVAAICYNKFKHRIPMTISFLIDAVALFAVGHVKSLVLYGICWFLVTSAAHTLVNVGLACLFGNYFPTKKGSALGWATAGSAMCNIISLPILTALTAAKGLTFACSCFGVYFVILAILNLILLPNNPEKIGYVRDNGDSDPVMLAGMEAKESAWTTREILTSKNFWLISIGYGLLLLITQGIGTQLVVFEMQNGVPQATAVGYMSIAGVVGIISSVVSGWVDQKFGVKVAGLILGICYALSCFAAGFLPFNGFTNFLFIGFFCAFMGSISNLPSSHCIGVFGGDFSKALQYMIVIVSLFSSMASFILGGVLSLSGSYVGAYRILCGLAVVAMILLALSDSKMLKKPGEKAVAVKNVKAAEKQR